jgi:hypothetical protein
MASRTDFITPTLLVHCVFLSPLVAQEDVIVVRGEARDFTFGSLLGSVLVRSVSSSTGPTRGALDSGVTDSAITDQIVVTTKVRIADLTSFTGNEWGFVVYRDVSDNIVRSELFEGSATDILELEILINSITTHEILAVVHSHPNGVLTQSSDDLSTNNLIRGAHNIRYLQDRSDRDIATFRFVIVGPDGTSRRY